MKVLYIGYYREASEWGKVTCDNILALDSVGVDVACRSVILGSYNQDIDPRIVELEQKDTSDCNICIQHVFPHDLVFSDKFDKTVVIFETDAISIKNTLWVEQLRLADHILVPNNDLKDSMQQMGLPAQVLHHCCDYERYVQKYPDIGIQEAAGKFKFYLVSELSDIKNIECAIRCFHSEFDRSEQAILIMKLSKFGTSDQELKQLIDSKITEIKQSLRMYKDINDYPSDVVITEDLSQDNLNSLHQYGDCFINVSHGEAWSSTTFDAMAFGNSPICSNVGGPLEYIVNGDCGIIVDGNYGVCQCSDAAFPDTFTGRDYWFEPYEKSIRKAMRFQFEHFKNNPIETARNWKLAGLQSASNFTREVVGRQFKEWLS